MDKKILRMERERDRRRGQFALDGEYEEGRIASFLLDDGSKERDKQKKRMKSLEAELNKPAASRQVVG